VVRSVLDERVVDGEVVDAGNSEDVPDALGFQTLDERLRTGTFAGHLFSREGNSGQSM
jgi:hypothetical protein